MWYNYSDIIEDLCKFLGQINSLLDKTELYEQIPDIDDLWILIKNTREEMYKLEDIIKNDKENLLKINSITIKEIHDILDKLEELTEKYSRPEDLLLEISKYKEVYKQVDSLLASLRRKLGHILRDLDESINNIDDIIQEEYSFEGRNTLNKIKELEEIKENIRTRKNTLNNYSDTCSRLRMQLAKYRSIHAGKDELAEYRKVSLHAARRLLAKIGRGLWTKEILDILTGLQSITATPVSESIEFALEEIGGEESLGDLSVDELFYRYPPFEPIAIKTKVPIEIGKGKKVDVELSGSHVWFVDSPNLSAKSREILHSRLASYSTSRPPLIINGHFEDRGSSIELKGVNPINIANIGYLFTRIITEDSKIWIKYGSEKLRNSIRFCLSKSSHKSSIEKCLQDSYTNSIRKISPEAKTYSATNLTYVWYCRLGFAISTDPWDYKDCPFKKYCGIGKSSSREKCPFWSYSRRIFPKVFPTIERMVYGLKLGGQKPISVFFPVSEKRVHLVEEYVGVQWNMPSTLRIGVPVTLSFEKPIIRTLPETNVVGFAIPLELVTTFIDCLMDDSFQPKYLIIPGKRKKTDILHVLMSKYYLWREGGRGLRLYRLLSRSSTKLLKGYKNLVKELLDKKNDSIVDDFKHFVVEVLGHTLAHLLTSFLINKLELDSRDLLYHYFIDKKNHMLFVLVAENSPYGNFNLNDYVNRVFDGSVNNMLTTFLRETISILSEHEKELQDYQQKIEDALRRYYSTKTGLSVKPLIDKIEDYYDSLVGEGLVLDVNSFTLHIILSQLYENFAKDAGVDYNTARKELDNILTYASPVFCVDGCTGCVVFDRGCHKPLAQLITLSRRLAQLFLDVFYEGKSIIVKGQKFGPVLLRTLPRRKLVAITPYIDKEGLELVKNLSGKNISVTLITRKANIEKFSKSLKDVNIKACFYKKPRHEKIFIIDDNLIVHTSWNLTISTISTNEFRLEWNPELAHQLENEILNEATCIE